jgi:hypothetical protein
VRLTIGFFGKIRRFDIGFHSFFVNTRKKDLVNLFLLGIFYSHRLLLIFKKFDRIK